MKYTREYYRGRILSFHHYCINFWSQNIKRVLRELQIEREEKLGQERAIFPQLRERERVIVIPKEKGWIILRITQVPSYSWFKTIPRDLHERPKGDESSL